MSISTAASAGPTFATSTLAVSPAGTTVQAVVGDVNGDGQNDLVVLSDSSLRIYSVTANGGATLQQSVAVTSAPDGWAYAQPRIADVDGDGDRDVALYLRSDGQPGILQLVKWEQASSSFSVAGPYTMPEADAAYSCDIADI
ncbi:MAG TPA: VCBS repeat-containing protein, partial [Thermoanaerobaculia bacterium]|nr:VCBS repeat-containing protein [Thermoanaerobaculia bacterium]